MFGMTQVENYDRILISGSKFNNSSKIGPMPEAESLKSQFNAIERCNKNE